MSDRHRAYTPRSRDRGSRAAVAPTAFLVTCGLNCYRSSSCLMLRSYCNPSLDLRALRSLRLPPLHRFAVAPLEPKMFVPMLIVKLWIIRPQVDAARFF